MSPKFDASDVDGAAEFFDTNGYVVFQNAIAPALAASFWSAVEDTIAGNAAVQFSMYGKVYRAIDLPDDLRAELPRIIDIQGHAPIAAHLMFCDPIGRFLERLYGTTPTCLQTLTYKFSSEQGAHSDYHLVSPPYVGDYDRNTLLASWIPFEPARADNGALIVYPRSHKLAKKRLSDFNDSYGEYTAYLGRLCESCGCPAESYEADVGDVLLWHGDFVHAGGPLKGGTSRPTRRSLVCHYAVVPSNRPSLTDEWVRLRTTRGSYYVPASAVISATAGLAAARPRVTSA